MRTRGTLAVAIAAVAIAGCGGSDDRAEEPTTTAAATTLDQEREQDAFRERADAVVDFCRDGSVLAIDVRGFRRAYQAIPEPDASDDALRDRTRKALRGCKVRQPQPADLPAEPEPEPKPEPERDCLSPAEVDRRIEELAGGFETSDEEVAAKQRALRAIHAQAC